MSSEHEDAELKRINKKKFDALLETQRKYKAQAPTEGKPIVLSDVNFATEVPKHKLIVVDFWAPWCGPCRMVAPIIEQLAQEYSGRVAFGKVNVDDNPMVSERFGIQSIPTMIAFQNGKLVTGLLGASPKAAIEEMFKPYLAPS